MTIGTRSKYKAASGQYLTKALFFENNLTVDKDFTVYTLKDEDHLGYPSLKLLYMSESDLTEYVFANKHLAGWKHWTMIRKAPWFRELYSEWRDELEIKMMSLSLAKIQNEAQDTDRKNSYNANRYLLEQGWIPKAKGGVGRTTKAQIKQEANRLFTSKKDVDDDYKRIMN